MGRPESTTMAASHIVDFATVEKSDAQDLLKWKSLSLDAIQFNLGAFQLRIGEINLAISTRA